MKSPGAGAAKAKTARYDSMGKPIPSGKVGHHQKRVLRSRKETSARSVDSQCESPVIEPRNNMYRGSLCCHNCRGNTKAPFWPGVRSRRGLRSGQTHRRVVREHGRSENVLVWTTGIYGLAGKQSPIRCGTRVLSRAGAKNKWDSRQGMTAQSATTESRSKKLGRLSRRIVPLKTGGRTHTRGACTMGRGRLEVWNR